MPTTSEAVDRCGKCGLAVDLSPLWEGGTGTPFDCVWCMGDGCEACNGTGVTIICNQCIEFAWVAVVGAFRKSIEDGGTR